MRTRLLAAVAVGSLVLGGIVVPRLGADENRNPKRESLAAALLKSGRARFITAPALTALRIQATGNRSFGAQTAGNVWGPEGEAGARAERLATGAKTVSPSAGWANVRVNDPTTDVREDQTTQSETTLAVSGSHVVVAYNDSQQTGVLLTSGSDLSGYSYSDDGGTTWHDGGALRNAPGAVNAGDPWLATDRAGHVFYSNLSLTSESLGVSVARSDDHGHTFGAPVTISEPGTDNDKEAMTVGRDRSSASRDVVYVAWDNFGCDDTFETCFAGLPVARSADGGRTFTLAYADRVTQDIFSCDFAQYLGAQPLVDPANGTLYVAAERIAVEDPECTGEGTLKLQEVLFTSTDGGRTFGPMRVISNVTPVNDAEVIELGAGRAIRTAEFPVLAIRNGTLYAAWNEGTDRGAKIRFARSTNGGQTWARSWASSVSADAIDLQPALVADGEGLHLYYYEVASNGTISVIGADSPFGTPAWAHKRVSNVAFPGVPNSPQFDPIIAEAYMGDYIGAVSDGTKQYVAWGDNRDTVHNSLWPQGRNDPNVYFAAG